MFQLQQNLRKLFDKFKSNEEKKLEMEAKTKAQDEARREREKAVKKEVGDVYTNYFLNVHGGINFDHLTRRLDSSPCTELPITGFGPLHQSDVASVWATEEHFTRLKDSEALKHFADMNEYGRCSEVRDVLERLAPCGSGNGNDNDIVVFRCDQLSRDPEKLPVHNEPESLLCVHYKKPMVCSRPDHMLR